MVHRTDCFGGHHFSGPPLGKGDEENSLNQSALKQAISGTTTINKQTVMNKSSSRSAPSSKAREANLDKGSNVQNRFVLLFVLFS